MADLLKTLQTPARNSPAPLPIPKTALPGYQILGVIGSGGMGVVYRARQLGLNRLVALKMILSGAHANAQEVARFRIEAEAVARLQHPNIVQIYEIGEHEGLPYLCLELVDGPSLDKAAQFHSFSPRQAADLVATLARALHHVHQKGIVHRDLKPANILLQIKDCRLQNEKTHSQSAICELQFAIPKVTDFGLAKILRDSPQTCQTTSLVGTPNYMAPEQAVSHGQSVSPLADVYSLGAILYQLLTGRPPFEGKSVLDVLDRVRSQDPVPPRLAAPQVPRDLETICLHCLKKAPGQRYASALALAEDLERFLAHEPIQARPSRFWQRPIRWARRRPALAGLVGVTAAALIVFAFLELRHGLALQAVQDQAQAGGHQQQLVELEHARAMHRAFAEFRGDALFHWTFATVLPSSDSQAQLYAAKTSAEKALGLVNMTGACQSPPALNPLWTEGEKAEVSAGCYQLCQLLADAVALPLPEMSADDHSERLRQAVGMLDRAATLFAETPAYHFRRARYLKELGEEAEARREMERGSSMAPVSFVDHILLGDERYQRGEVQAAAQHFHKALVLEPSDFWSQYYLALCKLKLHQPAEAEVGLTKCLAQRPDFVWANLLRGLAFTELGEFEAAERDFRKLLDAQTSAEVRHAALVSRGLLRLQANRLEDAVADLLSAIDLKPSLTPARMSLARVYQRQNQLEKSNRQLEAVLALHPDALVAAECQTERSYHFYVLKRFPEALAASEAALQVVQDFKPAHARRAFALMEFKRFGEALESFDKSLAKGERPGTDLLRARGRARMQLGDFRGAAEDYSKAMETVADPELLVHRGWAYGFADAWKLALHDFNEAIRLDANQRDAFTGLGLAEVMLGNFRAGIADAEQALLKKPQAPEMMHNIACTFALAAAGLAKEPAETEAQALAAACQERALEAVGKTLDMVAPADRPSFWRERIFPDPALSSIRNCQAFKDLEARFGK